MAKKKASKQEMARMLAKVPLFDGLSRRELTQVLSRAQEHEYAPGRDIVKQGARGVGFHMILDGNVSIYVDDRKRRTIGPGEYFGEISLIDRGPRSATVRAESEVHILSIPSWLFLPMLDEHPQIAKKILVELCQRIRQAQSSPLH